MLWFAYLWLTREKWQGSEGCLDCAVMGNDTLQRFVGTVEIAQNGEWLFTDRLTNMTYRLTPCDKNCGINVVDHFDKINLKDPVNKLLVYFNIEGKYITEKKEFVYSFIIPLNERIFVNPKDMKSVPFDEIKDKYAPLEEENFMLNESHYAGLRTFLPYHFTKEQLKQPIPLKETTWETSDSTLITIWYEQKLNKWAPIKQHEWKKGMEF